MSFEGQYLTYAEYKSLGGTLEETPFNLLEYEARRKIDARTFNRIKNSESEVPQEVKLCEYDLISSIERYKELNENISSTGSAKSESIDGYSVTYTTTGEMSDVIKSKESELDDIIKTYLAEVIFDKQHLIFCGVE